MNETLKEIHDLLVDRVDSLSDAVGKTNDVATAKQLLVEMQEVLHRVNVTQNLLFTQASQELKDMLPAIKQADSELKQSLQSVQNAVKVIAQTSQLLEYVDKALDLAKTLALI
jgi:hypothetical protein